MTIERQQKRRLQKNVDATTVVTPGYRSTAHDNHRAKTKGNPDSIPNTAAVSGSTALLVPQLLPHRRGRKKKIPQLEIPRSTAA